jgi:hypothetical protein
MARCLFGSPRGSASTARPPGGGSPRPGPCFGTPRSILPIDQGVGALINGSQDPPRGEDEIVEEYFGQLWVILSPRPPGARVLALRRHDPLVWIRLDLLVSSRFEEEDCFPARASDLDNHKPTNLSFSWDFWSRTQGRAILRRCCGGGRCRVEVSVCKEVGGRGAVALLTFSAEGVVLRIMGEGNGGTRTSM